jgi:hypothetical protein
VPRTRDYRRYSTAGNLDIYRPKQTPQIQYVIDHPDKLKVEQIRASSAALVPYTGWRAHVHDGRRTNDLLNEYELRKEAEMRVRGRSNGPRLYASEVTYLPYVSRSRARSTPPPEVYRTSVEARPTTRPSYYYSGGGRKVSDGQYELDQFEKLMKRNFGTGGVNRNKTLLYTSPPYSGDYEYTLPYTSYSYTTLPRAGSSYYYGGRPYYSEYYNYPYYSQPYYVSSYAPYHYDQRTTGYEYPLYSPPTRVTAPSDYSAYYDYYGRSWLPPRYTSYSY